MPIHDIQTKEYECIWCKYRWINRFNGNDGPIPNNCAKCKRANWNTGENTEAISPKERGLRRRIRELNQFYDIQSHHWSDRDGKMLFVEWPTDLCQKFLDIQPRPTINEMTQVLYVFQKNIVKRKRWGWILHPDEPGWIKYDAKGYVQVIKQQAQKRQEFMIQMMKSRGVDYDPAPILKVAMDKYLQEERKEQLAHEESIRTYPQREKRVKKEIAEVRQRMNLRKQERRRKKSEAAKVAWAKRKEGIATTPPTMAAEA